MAVAAIFISLLALIIATYDTYAKRKHYSLSSRPLLNLNKESDSSGKVILYELVNKGLGSAIIKKIVIICGNETYENPSSSQFYEIIKTSGYKFANTTIDALYSGVGIVSGEKIQIIRLAEISNIKKSIDDIYKPFNHITLNINYESIYEEKFKLIENLGEPEQLNKLPPTNRKFNN